MEVLHDPVAYAIGLIAILVAVLVGLAAQARRGISFEVLSISDLLTAHEEMEGRLLVTFDGESVKDISIVLFQIFNKGNTPLPERDFVEPLSVAIQGRGRILSAEVIETVPEQLTVDVAAIAADGDEAVLAPTLLNAGDVITLKLVVTELHGAFVLRGRVVGVSEFSNAALHGYRAELARLLWFASVFVGGLAGLVTFMVFALAIGPSFNEWPSPLGIAFLVACLLPGIFAGNFFYNHVERGPRGRSQAYGRILKQREANMRRRS